jgi:hypothetical protein
MPLSLTGHFALCSAKPVAGCTLNYTKPASYSQPPFSHEQVYGCMWTLRTSELIQLVLWQCAERFSLDNAGLGWSFTHYSTTIMYVHSMNFICRKLYFSILLCEQQIPSSINRQYTQLSIWRALQSLQRSRHVSASRSSTCHD